MGIGVLIVLIVVLYSGLHMMGFAVFSQKGEDGALFQSKTIVKDGVAYFPRQDIITLLVTGSDESGPVQSSGYHRNDRVADTVLVMVFDRKAKECSVLALNRDTMVEMPELGIGGKQAGTIFGQLALANTYGSGLQDSCENMRRVVSDLLLGMDLDYYLSMNMDAVAILNDAVGGVTVNVTDDFSDMDPSIKMGEMTLHGEQALHFVRGRMSVGDGLNVSRMARQEVYIKSFMDALSAKLQQDNQFFSRTYGDVAEYIVSDCPVNTLSKLVKDYETFTLKEYVTPEGENILGEMYMEFYPDEEQLEELVLRLFYKEKGKE